MIISHRYRFIFLKTEKTASSSLERVFEAIAGEHDVLHPADPPHTRKLLGAGATLETLSFRARRGGGRRLLPGFWGLHRHARARDVRDFLGPQLFAQYTVITSERNPFDRQVSLYSHRQRGRDPELIGFSRSVTSPTYNLLHYNRLDNWGIYTLDGAVCAHHVIRFESLSDDFAAVLRSLGVDGAKYALPHTRQSRSESSPAYRTVYTDAARDTVARWYRNELDHFGYAF